MIFDCKSELIQPLSFSNCPYCELSSNIMRSFPHNYSLQSLPNNSSLHHVTVKLLCCTHFTYSAVHTYPCSSSRGYEVPHRSHQHSLSIYHLRPLTIMCQTWSSDSKSTREIAAMPLDHMLLVQALL